jgi:hypothetical protein
LTSTCGNYNRVGLRDGLELHREVRRLADRDWFMTVGLIEGRAAGIPVGITLGGFGTDSSQTPRWSGRDSNPRSSFRINDTGEPSRELFSQT